MLREISIQLISKTKKLAERNRSLNQLIILLSILLLPLIIAIRLAFILIMIVWSFLKFGKPSNFETQERDAIEEKWYLLISLNDFKLEQKHAGSTRFGPAYFAFKSQPYISSFQDKIFGDWFYKYKDGVFLQQWNSKVTPDTNLIFIDTKTLEMKTIKKNIPSVFWTVVESEDKTVQLNCDTGQEILTYKIESNEY